MTTDSPISIDYDILLYPSYSNISYYTYNQYGKTSQNGINGNSTFYEYDKLGRLLIVQDQDNNVRQRFIYNYQPSEIVSARFDVDWGKKTVGEPIIFYAEEHCIEGGTFKWDFGDGTPIVTINDGNLTPSHTYTDYGEYTVTLTTSHDLYEGSSYSMDIKVEANIQVSICTTGPVYYHYSTSTPIYESCNGRPQEEPGTNTFYATVSGVPFGANISYSWEKVENNVIEHYGNESSQYFHWTEFDNTQSYTKPVTCNVFISDSSGKTIGSDSATLEVGAGY